MWNNLLLTVSQIKLSKKSSEYKTSLADAFVSSFSVKHLSDVVSNPNSQAAFKSLKLVEFSGCVHSLNRSIFDFFFFFLPMISPSFLFE